jgi:hypothetical protein
LEEKVKLNQKKRTEIEKQLEEQHKKVQGEIIPEIEKRGIVMGKQLFDTQSQYEGEIYLDKPTGELHFPVLFLYEEFQQTDFIKDFNENHNFLDHLSYMFPSASGNTDPDLPPVQPAPWDSDKNYLLENLEIYVELGVVAPLKQTTRSIKQRWLKINLTTTLKKVLCHADYVVPHFPAFYVISSKSKFKEVFLKRHD